MLTTTVNIILAKSKKKGSLVVFFDLHRLLLDKNIIPLH